MNKAQTIFLSCIALAAFIVILLIKTSFSGKGSSNEDLIKQLISAKDSLIKSEKSKISIYEQVIEEKQRTFEVLGQRDSVLNSHYAETESLYKKLNENLRNIPSHIRSISSNNDSLRSEFAKF